MSLGGHKQAGLDYLSAPGRERRDFLQRQTTHQLLGQRRLIQHRREFCLASVSQPAHTERHPVMSRQAEDLQPAGPNRLGYGTGFLPPARRRGAGCFGDKTVLDLRNQG